MARSKTVIHTPFTEIKIDVSRYNAADASDHIFWGVIYDGYLFGFMTVDVGMDVPASYETTPRGYRTLRVNPTKSQKAAWLAAHPDAKIIMTEQEFKDRFAEFNARTCCNRGDFFEMIVHELFGQKWSGRNSTTFWTTSDLIVNGMKISIKGPRATLCTEPGLNQAETELAAK